MKKRKIPFPSDKELIDRINKNDPTAKNILCQKYISKCHKIADQYYKEYPAIGNKEDFFSLAIEILGRAIKSFSYTHSSFKSYFLACVEHKMSHYIEKNYNQNLFEKQALSLDYYNNDGLCLHDSFGTIDSQADKNLLKDTFVDLIMDPVNNFKEREAQIVLLFLDGYSLTEISSMLKIRYSSIHRYYTLSIKKMRKLLKTKR